MFNKTYFDNYKPIRARRLVNFKTVSKTFLLTIFLAELFSLPLFAQPLAASKNKFVGNVITNGNSIRSNFTKYWNQVTAENAGKWGSVEFSPGNYSWTQLDNIYNFSKNNSMPYKHHTLIWGSQLQGKDTLKQLFVKL